MELIEGISRLSISPPPHSSDLSLFNRVEYMKIERNQLISMRKKLRSAMDRLNRLSEERIDLMDDYDFNQNKVGGAAIAQKIIYCTRSATSTARAFSTFAIALDENNFSYLRLSEKISENYPDMIKLRYMYSNMVDPYGLYSHGEIETFFGDMSEYLVEIYSKKLILSQIEIFNHLRNINHYNLTRNCGLISDDLEKILGHPDLKIIFKSCVRVAQKIMEIAKKMNPPDCNEFIEPHADIDTDLLIGKTIVELKFKKKKVVNDSGYNNAEYTIQAFHYAYKLYKLGFNSDNYLRLMSVDISAGTIDAYILDYDDICLYDEIMSDYSRI